MKPRGDGTEIKLTVPEMKYDELLERKTLHTTTYGKIWRRPLVLRNGHLVVRFNYGYYLVGHDGGIMLNDQDKELFDSKPSRFNGELLNGD